MDERLVLVQALVAVLSVAAALAIPRIQRRLADRDTERERALSELDAVAVHVHALSTQIQSELVFPQFPTLKTVEPVHNVLYVRPEQIPDMDSVRELLRIAERARELNHAPKRLLLWTLSHGERQRLAQELADAEAQFVAAYWAARARISGASERLRAAHRAR